MDLDDPLGPAGGPGGIEDVGMGVGRDRGVGPRLVDRNPRRRPVASRTTGPPGPARRTPLGLLGQIRPVGQERGGPAIRQDLLGPGPGVREAESGT